MKSISFKLLLFALAVFSAAALSAAPTKSTNLQKLLKLQEDSTVNIHADQLTESVVYNVADTLVSDDDDEVTAEIDSVFENISSRQQSTVKTITRGIVGVFAIVVPFAFIILLIWLIFRYSTSRNRERNKLIEMSIRERVPLPDAFYKSEQKYYTGPKRLGSGIIWIGVGVAFTAFFACAGSDEMSMLGIIPMFVGIARIVVYFVSKYNDRQN